MGRRWAVAAVVAVLAVLSPTPAEAKTKPHPAHGQVKQHKVPKPKQTTAPAPTQPAPTVTTRPPATTAVRTTPTKRRGVAAPIEHAAPAAHPAAPKPKPRRKPNAKPHPQPQPRQVAPRKVSHLTPVVAETASIPLGLIAVLVAFFVLQSRIDRRDPKLRVTEASSTDELVFNLPRGVPATVPRRHVALRTSVLSPVATSTRIA